MIQSWAPHRLLLPSAAGRLTVVVMIQTVVVMLVAAWGYKPSMTVATAGGCGTPELQTDRRLFDAPQASTSEVEQ